MFDYPLNNFYFYLTFSKLKYNHMIKNLFPLMLLMIIVSVSCSDDNDNGDNNGGGRGETKNLYKTGNDLSSSSYTNWDKKGMQDIYFMLGYGYDVTGKYAHPSSVRSKVLDLDKYESDYEHSVEKMWSSSAGAELGLSGTKEECIGTMGERAGFSENEITKYKNLFKVTFDSAFKNDTTFRNLSYRYMSTSQVYTYYHTYFMYLSYMQERFQDRYLTDEFKNDIESKSAEEIINKYGTHILRAIIVGFRGDYLYRYAEDGNANSYNWFLYNIHNYFSVGPWSWASEPQGESPLKENLYIEMIDGKQHNSNNWMVDITNYTGEPIVFNGWKDINDEIENLTLINFRSKDCLIPIYEFVKDPLKKEELIKAYERYLSE